MNTVTISSPTDVVKTTVSYKDGKLELSLSGEGLSVSDEYHSMEEIYSHRVLLFVALLKSHPTISWKSKKHSDGTDSYEGWIVAGMKLPSGDITYHIPESYWGYLSNIETLEQAPKFDGHTSVDVLHRLNEWVGM